MVGSIYWEQESARDAVTFLSYFDLKMDDINLMIMDMVNIKQNLTADAPIGEAHYSAACKWVENNIDLWKQWLPEVT